MKDTSPDRPVQPLYYYTRPTIDPGDYLMAYIKAYDIRWKIWIPFWMTVWFISLAGLEPTFAKPKRNGGID